MQRKATVVADQLLRETYGGSLRGSGFLLFPLDGVDE